MKTLFVVCAALALAGSASAQDKKLLVDKAWKVVKSEEAPPGTEFRFDADGKVAVTIPLDGRKRVISGTYSLAGNVLTLKLSHEGRERTETRTVKKLTATSLVTEDKNSKVEELQRD